MKTPLWLCVILPCLLTGGASAAVADVFQGQQSLDEIQLQVLLKGASQKDFANLEALVGRQPHDAKAHYVLGLALEQKGYGDLARQQFLAVCKDDPEMAQQLSDRFSHLMQKGEFAAASQFVAFVRAYHPGAAEVSWYDGILYREDGKAEYAMAMFRAASRRNPDLIGVASAIAGIFVERGDFGQALPLVAKDLARQPDCYDANVFKGAALVGLGHDLEALEPLQRAYEKHPDWPGSGLSYASDLVKTKQVALAVEPCLADLACERRPLRAEEVQQLLLRILPSADEATRLSALEGAANRLAGSLCLPNLYLSLADVYDQLFDYALACRVRALGLNLDANNARAHFAMGRSLEHQGLFKQAQASYETAGKLDPDNREYQAVCQRCRQRADNYENDLAARLRDFMHGQRN